MKKMNRIILCSVLLLILAFLITSRCNLEVNTVFAATAKMSEPKLEITKKTLYIGHKPYSLSIAELGKDAKITYKSSNSKIAAVDFAGKVTPLTKGTTTIKAVVKQSNMTYSFKLYITVENPYIKLTDTAEQLKVGETYTFKAKVYGISDKVIWSVSNKKIATIDSSTGKLKAKAGGNLTVTAKAGKFKETYKVTILGKLTAEDIYKKGGPATVEILAKYGYDEYDSLGSGFFIDKGVIVTNYHVIKGCSDIEITTHDKKKHKVNKILGYDETLDIAILSTSANYKSLPISQKEAKVGETIYALGSPFGLTGTLTEGIVSSASRTLDGVEYIQISAAISEGNSGGPLMNAYGEVIGINTLTYLGGQNLNFSLNIKQLDKIDITHPLTVTEYWDKYYADLMEELYKDMLLEDSELSKSMNTCQTLVNGTEIYGIIEPTDNKTDYYKIVLNSSEKVYLLTVFGNYYLEEDSMSVTLLYKDGTTACESIVLWDIARVIEITLPAGEYYLQIKQTSDDLYEKTGYGILYREGESI